MSAKETLPNFPLPWEVSRKGNVIDSDGDMVIRIEGEGAIEDAALIVRAVNSHEKLVEALRAISMVAGNLPDERLTDRTGPNDAAHRGLMVVQAREIAKAALKLAEG